MSTEVQKIFNRLDNNDNEAHTAASIDDIKILSFSDFVYGVVTSGSAD